MSSQIDLALHHVGKAIRDHDVKQGMASLFRFLRTLQPDNSVCDALKSIQFQKDVLQIRKAVTRALASTTLDNCTHIYFGLDDLNMPQGKGIEFAGGDGTDYSTRLGDIESPALSAIFTAAETNVAQYTLGLGYLGLALKSVFAHPDLLQATNPANAHVILFGFHDGDLFNLGNVKHSRFSLDLDKHLCSPVAATPPPASLKKIWPGKDPSAADWFKTAARAALLIPDPRDRVRTATLHLEKLCEYGRSADAARLLPSLMASQSSLNDPSDHVGLQLCAARVSGAQGDRKKTLNALMQARSYAAKISDEYWRKNAYKDVLYASANAGMTHLVFSRPSTRQWRQDWNRVHKVLEKERAANNRKSFAAALQQLDQLISAAPGQLGNLERATLRIAYLWADDSIRLRRLDQLTPPPDEPLSERDYIRVLERTDRNVKHNTPQNPEVNADRILTEVENDHIHSRTGNFHHLMLMMETAVSPFLDGNHSAIVDRLMPRVISVVSRWDLSAISGTLGAATLRSLADIFARLRMRDEALQLLNATFDLACTEKSAPSRVGALVQLAASFDALEAWDQSAACAKEIGDPNKRRMVRARTLLRRQKWSELSQLLKEVTAPDIAADLAMQLAWATDKHQR